jgi:hypothetical protein
MGIDKIYYFFRPLAHLDARPDENAVVAVEGGDVFIRRRFKVKNVRFDAFSP